MKQKFFNSIATRNGWHLTPIAVAFVLLAFLGATSSTAQSKKQKRVTSVRLGSANEGSRVTVVSDSALNDYEAYRRGDRFYVKIPSADFASGVPNIRGAGFEDVKVQKAEDGSIISFRLQPGTAARVDQRSNRLDVVFSTLGRSENAGETATNVTGRAQNSNGDRNDVAGSSPPSSIGKSPDGRDSSSSTANTIDSQNQSTFALPQSTQGPHQRSGASQANPDVSSSGANETATASPLGASSPSESLVASISPGEPTTAEQQPTPTDQGTISSQTLPVQTRYARQWLARNWLLAVIAAILMVIPLLFVVFRRFRLRRGRRPKDSLVTSSSVEFKKPQFAAVVDNAVSHIAAAETAASSESIVEPVLLVPPSSDTRRTQKTVEPGVRVHQSVMEGGFAVEKERFRLQEEALIRVSGDLERRRLEAEEVRKQAEEEDWLKENERRATAEAEARLRAAEATRQAADEARRQVQEEALLKAEREIFAGSGAEANHRPEEDASFRMEAGTFRRAAEELALRRSEAEIARLSDDEARPDAEEEVRQRTADEARLRAQEEAQRMVEDELRRQADEKMRLNLEDEARRLADEEVRRRVDEQRLLVEAEERRRLAEERLKLEQEALMQAAVELTRRRAEVEAARSAAEEESRLLAEAQEKIGMEDERRRLVGEERLRLEAEAHLRAQEERRRVEEFARLQAEEEERRLVELDEVREQAQRQARQRAEQEQRIRAEIEVLRQAEVEQNKRIEAETRRRAEAEARLKQQASHQFQEPVEGIAAVQEKGLAGFGEDSSIPFEIFKRLNSDESRERSAALAELAPLGGHDVFSFVSRAFDDESTDVRNAAAHALYDMQPDRAASFTRALREGSPERRRRIGAALAASGLANNAINNLTGESREKIYDAFSLLFLMAKAGEVQPLMQAIEEHANVEVRLAVVKLLALSGQSEIVPAFRRLAVRGSLPSEVRSAVMEAIYQMSSQASENAHSLTGAPRT